MATFSVSLPDDEIRLIDEAAIVEGRSRTGQIRYIIKVWLEERRHNAEEREVKP